MEISLGEKRLKLGVKNVISQIVEILSTDALKTVTRIKDDEEVAELRKGLRTTYIENVTERIKNLSSSYDLPNRFAEVETLLRAPVGTNLPPAAKEFPLEILKKMKKEESIRMVKELKRKLSVLETRLDECKKETDLSRKRAKKFLLTTKQMNEKIEPVKIQLHQDSNVS